MRKVSKGEAIQTIEEVTGDISHYKLCLPLF